MKTFYQFLIEAPQPDAASATPPSPASGGPGSPTSPPSPPGGGLGGPPSPLGSLGGPGGGLGGPPSPDLGGATPPSGSAPSGAVSVKKIKPLSVWDALEKLISGQKDDKITK